MKFNKIKLILILLVISTNIYSQSDSSFKKFDNCELEIIGKNIVEIESTFPKIKFSYMGSVNIGGCESYNDSHPKYIYINNVMFNWYATYSISDSICYMLELDMEISNSNYNQIIDFYNNKFNRINSLKKNTKLQSKFNWTKNNLEIVYELNFYNNRAKLTICDNDLKKKQKEAELKFKNAQRIKQGFLQQGSGKFEVNFNYINNKLLTRPTITSLEKEFPYFKKDIHDTSNNTIRCTYYFYNNPYSPISVEYTLNGLVKYLSIYNSTINIDLYNLTKKYGYIRDFKMGAFSNSVGLGTTKYYKNKSGLYFQINGNDLSWRIK